ncbi:unnamed protein product [Urochloa humidicola]
MRKSGRLIVVRSIATAVPIYMLMANNLPDWAIEEINVLCRKFLWAGGDQSARGKCMVAWPVVCRPTKMGGLGIIDLKLCIALQSRWLWLQKIDHRRAWSALEIHVEPEVEAFFHASVSAILGDGTQIHFWTDSWIAGSSVQCLAPNLVKLVPPRFRKKRTAAEALPQQRWTRDVTGALNPVAMAEYDSLWDRMSTIRLQAGQDDQFVWKWTPSGTYTAHSAYMALHQGAAFLPGARLIWKTWAPLKVKFFLWLAFRSRLWTADRRIRHGLQANATCTLCDQENETSDHILFRCSYSAQVWWEVLHRLGIQSISPSASMRLHDWWSHLRQQVLSSKKKGFDTLFALVAWQIWKERNARVFRNHRASSLLLLQMIKLEGDSWIAAGAKKLGCLFAE